MKDLKRKDRIFDRRNPLSVVEKYSRAHQILLFEDECWVRWVLNRERGVQASVTGLSGISRSPPGRAALRKHFSKAWRPRSQVCYFCLIKIFLINPMQYRQLHKWYYIPEPPDTLHMHQHGPPPCGGCAR